MRGEGQDGYLSRRTKRAILVLFILSIMVAFSPRIYFGLFPAKPSEITTSDLYLNEKIQEKVQVKKRSKSSSSKKASKKYFAPSKKFDPNQYLVSDWLALGLSQKQAESILKFSKRGLRSNEDLQKIYVLPEEVFELIKDSTYYPSAKKTAYPSQSESIKSKKLVHINLASKEELKSVPGIGDFFADKIIERRDKLGGFSSIEQLLEVYKVKEETIQKWTPYIIVLPEEINKIQLNRVTMEQLKRHPYLNYSVANSIIKMRQLKGAFENIEEIKESVLIDEILFQKIKPYLSL